MRDWNTFWQSYRPVPVNSDEDLLYQVGMTVQGKAISKEVFDLIVSGIRRNLAPASSEVLLDICCGNGVITYALAPSFARTIGIDFSVPNIENARRYKQGAGMEYQLLDATKIASAGLPVIDKALMYGCLMYFTDAQFATILTELQRIGSRSLLIFGGAVLDQSRKWNFFNTPARVARYAVMRLLGRDAGLGRWWHPTDVQAVAKSCGFECDIIAEAPLVHTAHYRFDFLLRRSQPTPSAA